MSIIKCAAESCGHNADGRCARGHIDVCCCGDSTPAFCADYNGKRRAPGFLEVEMGELFDTSPARAVIDCDVSQCTFNRSGRCESRTVDITAPIKNKDKKCFCSSYTPDKDQTPDN